MGYSISVIPLRPGQLLTCDSGAYMSYNTASRSSTRMQHGTSRAAARSFH